MPFPVSRTRKPISVQPLGDFARPFGDQPDQATRRREIDGVVQDPRWRGLGSAGPRRHDGDGLVGDETRRESAARRRSRASKINGQSRQIRHLPGPPGGARPSRTRSTEHQAGHPRNPGYVVPPHASNTCHARSLSLDPLPNAARDSGGPRIQREQVTELIRQEYIVNHSSADRPAGRDSADSTRSRSA